MKDGDADLNKSKLELEMLLSDQFKLQVFNGTWLSAHELVYVDQNGSIVIFDAATNKSSSMLVKTYDKTLHTMAGFKLSPDRQSILFVSDMRHQFGAPISGRYAVFNISSQTVEFLDDFIKASSGAPLRTPQVQFATWGPASNSIIFIESNDIYYVPDFATAHRLAGQPGQRPSNYLRLTKSGALSDSMRNGLPDSLYRTNIFTQANEASLWASPDGRYLAYLTFDDALVEPNPIEFYDSYLHDANYNPKIHYERYPRAGSMNPKVSIYVADLSSSSSDEGLEQSLLLAPSELIKQQQADPRLGYYVTYVGWINGATGNQLLVMWSDRAQTSSILSQCENSNEKGSMFGGRSNAWRCDILATFSQRLPPAMDAERTLLSAINANGTRLIFFALPRPDSIIGDHFHVALLRADERAPKYLTHGEFDIDRLLHYEAQTDTLYFEAKVSESAERHLYKIQSVAQAAQRQTKCLTCQLAEPCGYNYAHIAPGARYLVHECLGPSIPSTRLRLLEGQLASEQQESATGFGALNTVTLGAGGGTSNGTNNGNSSEPRKSLEQDRQTLPSLNLLGFNQNIEGLVRSKQVPIERFIAIKSSQQQVPCDVYMKLYLPTEIEEEKDKKFPLLIESSEIEQRNVWRKFELDWGKYLASKKQIIYAKIDCVRSRAARGATGGGGGGGGGFAQAHSAGPSARDADEQLLDSPLFNAKDQVDAIKFLVDNADLFPYIDRRRIAIWGPSSTSAYVALATTINDDAKLIQCTIAVSPITNWRYMSSYAAERYLGLPWLEANSLKYERANLLKRSYEFSLRKLLIVHGTADEQVHVQHSMQFIKSLTEHHITGGSLHQMQLYPDVGHSLAQVRRHFYLTLDGFVDRCFYQKPIAVKATEWKGKVRPKIY